MTLKPWKPHKKPRQSIIHDPVWPADWNRYQWAISCEDCTHWASLTQKCTLGYVSDWHRRWAQNRQYERTGKVAFCRFIELD